MTATPKLDDEQPDLTGNAQRLLDKHSGQAIGAIAELLSDNYRLREDRRALQQKAIPEGAVVLTGADVAKWEGLKGFDPADVTTKLAEHGDLAERLAKADRARVIGEAAQLHGMKASVLTDLAETRLGDGATIEIMGEGDKRKAVVKGKDGQVFDLTEYAKAQWADYAPALAVQKAGADWVAQPGAGGGAAPQSLVDARVEDNKKRAAAPNPLRKKT